MSNTYDTTQLSKEDLLEKLSKVENELQKFKRQRRYGIVWEERPEEVEKMFETHIPVLNEEENMKIIKDESKPHNLLLEGDNLNSLNVLKRTHREKVDVIYIDPPYNTGNKDFVYNDRYVDKEDSYRHSSWLSFMEKRLRVARELMSDEGVIFISIDDNEMAQLKLLCDQVFGEENFISNIIWQNKYTVSNDKLNGITSQTEYIICYGRKASEVSFNPDSLRQEYVKKNYKNPDNDPRGDWRTVQLYKKKNPNSYEVTSPTGKKWIKPWNYNREGWKQLEINNLLYWGKDGNQQPQKKIFLKDSKGQGQRNLLLGSDVGFTLNGGNEIEEILNNRNLFSYPKPTQLIRKLVQMSSSQDATVLDFFAGSGTTGHAVMELNKKDGGNRQFILCTNNEVSNEKEIDKLVKLGHIERFEGRKRTKKHKDWMEELSCFKETETYNDFLESDDYKNLGIARAVTYERLKRVINGYTTPKGKDVEGLPGNLHYYTTDFVDKANSYADDSELLDKTEVLIALEENTYCRQVIDGLVTLSSNEKQVYVYPNLYIAEKDANIIRNNLSVNKETIVYVLEDNASDIYLSELDATIKLLPNTFYKKGELANV